MSIESWWPRLRPETRKWLEDNNGEVVPRDVADEIVQAGGVPEEGAWWIDELRSDGFTFSDDATDWIEAVANGESPDPPIEEV